MPDNGDDRPGSEDLIRKARERLDHADREPLPTEGPTAGSAAADRPPEARASDESVVGAGNGSALGEDEPAGVKGPDQLTTGGLAELVAVSLSSKEDEHLRDEVTHGADDGGRGGLVLRFRLGDIAVSVHWSFLLVALLGLGAFSGIEIAVWTLAVFFAVLLHEVGHAFTARRFGAEPVAISLFCFRRSNDMARHNRPVPRTELCGDRGRVRCGNPDGRCPATRRSCWPLR